MTVLQICAFGAPSPGNFIVSLTSLEQTLREDGIETIYAFAETAKNRPWCEEICKRAKVYFLPVSHARILPKTYQIVRQIYQENQIDIVHSHFELYDIPATVMAPKNTKVFWHLHDPIGYNRPIKISRRVLTKLQYGFFGRRASLLSVSLEHAEHAADLGFDRKHIYYIPNGINTARIQTAFNNSKSNDFLMFGWDVIRKGVDLVVAADSEGALPPCRIQIIGQSACQQYLQDHLTEHIVFGKPVSDINVLYQNSKAFLHVSRAEGMSYALLEAVYAGLPVICSDIPENQVAREFSGIFWVKNENVGDIKKQIRTICDLASPVSESEYQENKAIIQRKYSLDAWKKRIVELYLTKEKT